MREMLQIESKGPNRIDLELSGKLDANEMKSALDELISKAEDIEHGRMLYRIVEFHLPTLGAIGVELSRLPGLLRMVGRFDRVAVLTEKEWLKKASEFEGALIPGLEIKAFALDEESQAEAWLAAP
jgi:hypothetical protein